MSTNLMVAVVGPTPRSNKSTIFRCSRWARASERLQRLGLALRGGHQRARQEAPSQPGAARSRGYLREPHDARRRGPRDDAGHAGVQAASTADVVEADSKSVGPRPEGLITTRTYAGRRLEGCTSEPLRPLRMTEGASYDQPVRSRCCGARGLCMTRVYTCAPHHQRPPDTPRNPGLVPTASPLRSVASHVGFIVRCRRAGWTRRTRRNVSR